LRLFFASVIYSADAGDIRWPRVDGTFFILQHVHYSEGVGMTRGILNKDVSTLSGVNVGKVKDVIINWDTKEVSLEVTRGLLKGETIVAWSKIISVGDIIIVSDDMAPEGRK
jgi:sporulation protein YlmC with PRC-barrel domain